MSLKITKNKGVFHLNGNINSETSNSLQTHLEFLISLDKIITINIDNVTEIDANGLLVLKNFYYSAIRKNKTFWITGVGCKEIYDEMKHSNVA